jgi:hypothetical protein
MQVEELVVVSKDENSSLIYSDPNSFIVGDDVLVILNWSFRKLVSNVVSVRKEFGFDVRENSGSPFQNPLPMHHNSFVCSPRFKQ